MNVFEIQGGFGIDNLKPAQRPEPEPGPGQVRLRIEAVSLNYRDLMIIKGTYNPRLKLPRIPGSDAAGVIDALGPGVSGLSLGQRVCGLFMPGWLEGELSEAKARSALGGAVDGVFAEQIVLPAESVVPHAEHLSPAEASTLPCAALTAWNALHEAGRLKSGESVLVQGTGGVSLFAAQFAHLAGARVIATSSQDARLERLRALGASDGINYRTHPGWGKLVRDLTGKVGVDHVVEVGGAGTLGQSLEAVRVGGHIALIGVLSGSGQVDPIPILMKGVRVSGIFVGSRAMFEAMNRAIGQARLRPVIDRIFPFEQLPQALRHLESGAHVGKVVVSR